MREDLDATRRAPHGGDRSASSWSSPTCPATTSSSCRCPNHPKDEACGKRHVPFSNELWIEREDFMEMPVEGLPSPDRRAAKCACAASASSDATNVVKDGGAREANCIARSIPNRAPAWKAPTARSRAPSTGCARKHAVAAEFRLYDRLFTVAESGQRGRRQELQRLPQSAVAAGRQRLCRTGGRRRRAGAVFPVRASWAISSPTATTTAPAAPVFNRSVTLRDTWAGK